MNRKLAIVGAHDLTRDNAPWNDTGCEIWAISNYANAPWMKRCDAVIEIHKPIIYQHHPDDKTYWEFLQWTDKPVYMLDPHTAIKNVRRYPLEEIKAGLLRHVFVHGKPVTNLGSSIDFALALAIYEQYQVIDVYGVEMGIDTKYVTQRPGFAFWVGLAAGHGLTVNINCTDGLFPETIYGRYMVDKSQHVAFMRMAIL